MQSLEHGRCYQSLILLFNCIKRNRADYISDLFEPRILLYNLRNRDHNLTQTSYNTRANTGEILSRGVREHAYTENGKS